MQEIDENPYTVLGLDSSASMDAIKQAYFGLVRAHPPEREPEAFKRFRAAYDFLELRGRSGEVPQTLVEWWTRFQDAPESEREAMLKPEEAPKKGRRSRGRGHKRRDDSGGPPPADGDAAGG